MSKRGHSYFPFQRRIRRGGPRRKIGTSPFSILSTVALALTLASSAHAAQLKFATLAPPGSAWGDVLDGFVKSVRAQTQGRVEITLYAGGVMGDDPDVVRKLRLGQIQGAAITAMGLGLISPEIRALELPFLMESYDQALYVLDRMFPTYRELYESKKYVLLGWLPFGAVYFFTQVPMKTLEDLKGQKLWAWAGDPLADAAFRELDLSPTPLPVVEVLPALQTGMVNAFYNAPMATVALQWHPFAKYMIETPFAMGMGGIVVASRAYASLSEEDRRIVAEQARIMVTELSTSAGKDNEKALSGLRSHGLKVLPLAPEAMKELKSRMERVYAKLVGTLYPDSLLRQIREAAAAYTPSR
ncbi:MAG: TRAP transporter substrate-binding protein DctP [Nitrospirae bacterium]|nr:TRAP transporter substrate-binding protein DctP [Nitrospirota bacterium]